MSFRPTTVEPIGPMYKVQQSFSEDECNQIVTALLDEPNGTMFELTRTGKRPLVMQKIPETEAFNGTLPGVHKCVGTVTNQSIAFQAQVFVQLIQIDGEGGGASGSTSTRGMKRSSAPQSEASKRADAAEHRATQFGATSNFKKSR